MVLSVNQAVGAISDCYLISELVSGSLSLLVNNCNRVWGGGVLILMVYPRKYYELCLVVLVSPSPTTHTLVNYLLIITDLVFWILNRMMNKRYYIVNNIRVHNLIIKFSMPNRMSETGPDC